MIAVLNSTSTITFTRTTEDYFNSLAKVFEKAIVPEQLIEREIILNKKRVEEAVKEGYLREEKLDREEIEKAEYLKGNISIIDAYVLRLALRYKERCFLLSDDAVLRSFAEKEGINLMWTTVFAVISHYLGLSELRQFLRDIEEKKILYVGEEVLEKLKLFEDRKACSILLDVEKGIECETLYRKYPESIIEKLIEHEFLDKKCKNSEKYTLPRLLWQLTQC